MDPAAPPRPPALAEVSGMVLVRRIHLFVAGLFVAGVVVQVFLAGLGVFDGPRSFVTHTTWGFSLQVFPLVLLVLALIGRLGRRQVVYPLVLIVMFILQSVFVAVRGDLPMVAALHPVNGFGILLIGIAMTRDAWLARDVRPTERAAASAGAS
jgi:hypothetical protein